MLLIGIAFISPSAYVFTPDSHFPSSPIPPTKSFPDSIGIAEKGIFVLIAPFTTSLIINVRT